MPTTTGVGPRNYTSDLGTDQHVVSRVADSTSLPWSNVANGNANAGKAVMTDPTTGKIELTANAEVIYGQLHHVERDQACAVIDEGVVLFPYTGTMPVPGAMIIGSTTAGAVRTATGGEIAAGSGKHEVVGNPTTHPQTCPAGFVQVKLNR